MEKVTLKLCSAVLSATTLMSMFSSFTTSAVELLADNDESQSQTTFSMVEAENGVQFYGATGDLSLEDEGLPDSVTVIESVDDYYSVTGKNQIQSNNKVKNKSNSTQSEYDALPENVDWCDSKYFPEVGNQGSIGSCVAWAQGYYQFTFAMNKAMDVETTSENTFSPKWLYALSSTGNDNGTSSDFAYEIMMRHGNAQLSQVPYDNDYLSWSPSEDIWKTAIKYRIKDYQYFKRIGVEDTLITSVSDPDVEILKTALYNGDLLTFSTYIESWKKSNIEKHDMAPENVNFVGDYIVQSQNGTNGSHRMTVVGYNDNIWTDINGNGEVDEGEKGAFKVVNSWGKNYCNDGFIWVAYDALNYKSCVEDVEDSSSRNRIFNEIARIDVAPYNTGTDLYLKFTLNSSKRDQTNLHIIAEKDDSRYFYEQVFINNYGACSYDGTENANDGTMMFALDNIIPDLDSESFCDYSWSIEFSDSEEDGNALIVKDAEIVDENLNKTYKLENVYPFTLDGEEKTVKMFETISNNVVVYYRGYSNPNIHYKVNNGEWTSESGVQMVSSNKQRGYTHKYVVKLEESSDVTLYFSDGNGNIDDNNGKYYTAKSGFNYYVTENARKPLTAEFLKSFDNTIDLDYICNFSVNAEGGYEPYQFQLVYENLTTGSEYSSEYQNSDYISYQFKEEGNYKVSINVKDFTDNVITISKEFVVENLPFEFSEFEVTPNEKILVGETLNFYALTKNEAIISSENLDPTYELTIKNSDEVCYTTSVNSDIYNTNERKTTVEIPWTPSKAGHYSATISSTDANKEYAEKTIYFDVAEYNGTIIGDANNDKKVTITDAILIMQCNIGIIGTSEIWFTLADCDKNNFVNTVDVICILRYVISSGDSAYAGEVNYKEPATEPATEPVTEPITEPETEPITEPVTEAEENIVTFTNSFNWSGTIYCYYWSDSNTSMTSWPGQAMTYERTNSYGEKLYTFEVPKNATYIIFTNGSSQTVNISYSGGEVRYYPISTTDSKGNYNVKTW